MWSSDSEEEGAIRQRHFPDRVLFNNDIPFKFNERFRLSSFQMEELHELIGGHLVRETNRSHALDSRLVLQIGLRWLGTGAQYHTIGDTHGISSSSVCRSLKEFVRVVNDVLLPIYVRWPDNCAGIVNDFFQIAQMPLVVGCVDGTLIKIDKPVLQEQDYVDRHGNHSINVMAVCGPNYQFFYVNANWPGSVHDYRIFRNSALCRNLQQGWRPFENGVLLGDSAYIPAQTFLIPPICTVPNDPAVMRFLRAHKRTRRMIECSFGILKEKFPCLNHLRVQPEYASCIIKACFTLCNFTKITEEDVNRARGNQEEEEEEEDIMVVEPNFQGNDPLQNYINYFRH